MNIITPIFLILFTGTYRAEDTMCYQTGLPLDKFSTISTSISIIIMYYYFYYLYY